MTRSTGGGVMTFGIVLVVIGAILEFAVKVTTEGFSIHTVGLILLLVGIGTFLVGMIMFAVGGSRRSVMTEEFRNTPGGGQQRVLEERDSAP